MPNCVCVNTTRRHIMLVINNSMVKLRVFCYYYYQAMILCWVCCRCCSSSIPFHATEHVSSMNREKRRSKLCSQTGSINEAKSNCYYFVRQIPSCEEKAARKSSQLFQLWKWYWFSLHLCLSWKWARRLMPAWGKSDYNLMENVMMMRIFVIL